MITFVPDGIEQLYAALKKNPESSEFTLERILRDAGVIVNKRVIPNQLAQKRPYQLPEIPLYADNDTPLENVRLIYTSDNKEYTTSANIMVDPIAQIDKKSIFPRIKENLGNKLEISLEDGVKYNFNIIDQGQSLLFIDNEGDIQYVLNIGTVTIDLTSGKNGAVRKSLGSMEIFETDTKIFAAVLSAVVNSFYKTEPPNINYHFYT